MNHRRFVVNVYRLRDRPLMIAGLVVSKNVRAVWELDTGPELLRFKTEAEARAHIAALPSNPDFLYALDWDGPCSTRRIGYRHRDLWAEPQVMTPHVDNTN